MTRALIVLLALAATASAAPCPRPAILPAELPLVDCPIRAARVDCLRGCIVGEQRFELAYARPAAALADAWRKALVASGWRIDPRSEGTTLVASRDDLAVVTSVSGTADASTLDISFRTTR